MVTEKKKNYIINPQNEKGPHDLSHSNGHNFELLGTCQILTFFGMA